ncbi:MAG TPA: uroporphyrinogen-III synthase [Sphingomicrobium sp.]|nr:uroporphyrinogen-III synthase [Sphingomicrobium sp.]
MRRVLVLRPEPGANTTVVRARERGLDAVAAPLFKIEPVSWQAPEVGGFDGLLLTSANAVRSAGGQLENFLSLPVYAVGEVTSEAARERGFGIAAVGDRGIDRLIDFIPPNLRLLHLGGEDRRDPLEDRDGVVVIPVYRARQVERPDLRLANGAVVLIHSPRAGCRFAELVKDRGDIRLAAISPAAARAAGTGWGSLEVAMEPNDDALLALAARLCDKPDPK